MKDAERHACPKLSFWGPFLSIYNTCWVELESRWRIPCIRIRTKESISRGNGPPRVWFFSRQLSFIYVCTWVDFTIFRKIVLLCGFSLLISNWYFTCVPPLHIVFYHKSNCLHTVFVFSALNFIYSSVFFVWQIAKNIWGESHNHWFNLPSDL